MKRLLFLLLGLCALYVSAQEIRLEVANDTERQRQQIVELSVAEVYQALGMAEDAPFKILNAAQVEVPYQITHDGLLLFEVAVRPQGKASYTLRIGTPNPMKPAVYGRQYPDRLDDIAWEHDRGAYRLYGPALQRTGERGFGIDVWTKSVPDLIVEQRYADELGRQAEISALRKEGQKAKADSLMRATSYHYDHGNGMDAYKVGATLGCGTPALMQGESLLMAWCYDTYRILDNGPLRFCMELTYLREGGITEHRRLSLDKGCHFNRMTVWYEGLPSFDIDMAAGIVIHDDNPNSVAVGKDYVQYTDPTDNPSVHNSQIFTAVLFPNGNVETQELKYAAPVSGDYGHVIGRVRRIQGLQPYTYYFGAAWSKYDVHDQTEWLHRIDTKLYDLRHPLRAVIVSP